MTFVKSTIEKHPVYSHSQFQFFFVCVSFHLKFKGKICQFVTACNDILVPSENIFSLKLLLLFTLNLASPLCHCHWFNLCHSGFIVSRLKSFGINIQLSCSVESIIVEEEISISPLSKGQGSNHGKLRCTNVLLLLLCLCQWNKIFMIKIITI